MNVVIKSRGFVVLLLDFVLELSLDILLLDYQLDYRRELAWLVSVNNSK